MKTIQELAKQVKALQRQGASITVPVTTLDPEPFELTKDIQVVVQQLDDQYVATFFDANINASGDTQQDAVANLKDMMLALRKKLETEMKLGKGPARQWAILRGLLRRKKKHGAHHQRARAQNSQEA